MTVPAPAPTHRSSGRGETSAAGCGKGVPAQVGAYGSIAQGYDVGSLVDQTAKGMEGYYLREVSDIGEPPGIWTGRLCAQMGPDLAPGTEVDPDVMRAVYGQMLDPRSPGYLDKEMLDEEKDHLGNPPRNYKSFDDRYSALLAKEPDASPERREQLQIQARKDARHAVMFFDFTFSVDKSTSVLLASLQAAAVTAGQAGDPEIGRAHV